LVPYEQARGELDEPSLTGDRAPPPPTLSRDLRRD
jgi:hypothetical protein